MIKIGETVKDIVTGFKGVVTSRTEYLYGCTRLGVQPKADKDGKMPEAQWFDEPALTKVKGSKTLERASLDTGGPGMGNPKGPSNPRR